MAIIEPVIRPPAEATSFLLQVTLGCSANDCDFCGAYLGKNFRIKNNEEIFKDIELARRRNPEIRKVFLLDGDALVVKNERILPIFKKLNEAFPKLTRISSYANGYNITRRSLADLNALYQQKLRLIYIGLESGSQDVLDFCHKPSSAEEMIEAVQKAEQAHIKSSVIVLLGLGGRKCSSIHVAETIEALNKMQPTYLSFLSVMVIPGTPLHEKVRSQEFKELNPDELLKEMHDIVKGLELHKTIFRSNHASNYLPLEGTFPKDKEKILNILALALQGKVQLRPEFLRGL